MSRTKPTSPKPSPKVFTLNPPSRDVLSRKLATQLLAPLSAHPYTTINLSGCAFGDAAATEAGPHLLALAQKKCLETVILSDIIASLEPEVALRSLSTLASSIGIWKQLISVDLSNNALGSRGLAQCAPLIEKQTCLQSLFLAETGLAAESARLLQTFFPSSTTSLRVIDIHGNRLESQGLIHIAAIVEKSPNLKRLRVSSVGASAEATAALARALASTSGITELDISDNSLDRAGSIALANVLIRQRSLSRLALADLCMGNESLIALLVPLTAAQCPIAELHLAGNELTSESMTAVGRYLRPHCTELRVLDLSGNDLSDEGVSQLAEAVRDAGVECALAKVLIADNEVGCLPLVILAQELVKLPGIRRYDVRGNFVSTRVGEALAGAFSVGVVAWDPMEDGTIPADGAGEELENALQALADMADVVERPVVSAPTAAQPPSATVQPPSALSRLGSWFSRGSASEESSMVASSRANGIGTTSATDDSGVIGDKERKVDIGEDEISGFTTPIIGRREVAGVTAMSTRAGDAIERLEEDVIRRVGGKEDVIESAKKLKASITELRKEIGDVTVELDTEDGSRRVVYSAESRDEDINRYLLVSNDERDRVKVGVGEVLGDACGGLMVAVFVIVLVLALVQSQEENTFTYTPV